MLHDASKQARIGLALSGGAVRGLAHLGVLSVLIKAGIPIEYVAGCSAGAILGAVYCAGMPLEEMYALTSYLTWRRLATPVKTPEGLLNFDRLERWITMLIGDLDFADLDIPLAVVTLDVQSGERVILREGRVAKAVRASCSIPGVFTPVQINGRLLADGGIVDNLPVDAARDLGAQFVIGVDVFEPLYSRAGGPLGKGLTALETLVRNAGGGVGQADFLISPETAGKTYIRFSKHHELVSLGEEAAARNLSCLLEEIGY